MPRWTKTFETESGYVEVLTSDKDGTPFGYRLVGARTGPQVVIAGTCPTSDVIFDRLMSLPTLPWMRGNLVLIRLDAMDGMLGDLTEISSLGEIDRTLVLPWGDKNCLNETAIRRSYHAVRRVCTDMGMISGRGVTRQIFEPAAA